MPEKQRRGYPVAILIGLSQKQTSIWRMFSETAKLEKTLSINRDDEKILYVQYEEIVDFIRPIIKSGIESVIIASPPRSKFADMFLSHIKKRHRWLVEGKNSVTIGEVTGAADTAKSACELVKGIDFKNVLSEITSQDSERIQSDLERDIESDDVLYTIDEIYNQIRKDEKPSLILITDGFYEAHKRNRRLQSFLQLAQNSLIRTRIIRVDSPLGSRIQQFGGLIALLK
jgi:stalled ribosome rescue protein Dom34